MTTQPLNTKPLMEVDGLAKRYRAGQPNVFQDIRFDIGRNEFICVIGHSGCGKSTILNILAGLETASEGAVVMNGKEVAGPGLDRGVVFQSHALLPWLTVRDNIAFAVRSRHPSMSKADVAQRVQHYIGLVGLSHALDKKPSELSGGMKQRVGIARAFSVEPKMLFMDEPFGALDALTRGVIQDELLKIVQETRQTVYMITHDIDEAILLADRIFLMSNGPEACIAEIVVNTIPKPRNRENMHHDPRFYAMRNHLLDFLVHRSKAMQAEGIRPKEPLIVYPGAEANETLQAV
ncbi:ABC transporter ATP-binding protein [Uruburuella testudinis]|uniref:ABC transporter ATP-binding protein n=1 Tax=Uruburuella testudinis TaxID=1282863 RepID=A0ABY4DT97_9NEIS|nr:ABC transporter ATP-binding protein [Uruburuella testudinis]UOO81915.1 ABC transporter ATP-binding protein [Uruburuella testudinis]